MVLVVMFLYFNVYMFLQKEDATFQDTVAQSQQLDADRDAEKWVIDAWTTPEAGDPNHQFQFAFQITNSGPIPLEIKRVWAFDSTRSMYAPISVSFLQQPIVLPSGAWVQRLIPKSSFGFPSYVLASDEFMLWLVTSRGNMISVRILPQP